MNFGLGGGVVASELGLVMSARAGIASELVFGGVVKTMGENLPEEVDFNEFWGASELGLVMSALAGIALELVFGGVVETMGERLPEEVDLNEFWPGKGGGASELGLVRSGWFRVGR